MTPTVIVRVGHDLQWPMVKDQPVVKVNARDYFFTLPVKDSDPLRYVLTFCGEDGALVKSLEFLEEFIKENSCLSKNNNEINWKKFSPKAEDYKNVMAKAIAGGTEHIIKGILTCSNSYSKKIHKGGDNNETKKKNKLSRNLQRVEKLWNATEIVATMVLDGEEMVSGLVIAPVVKSKLGQVLLSTAPGEILLASLNSFNTILGASEAAVAQTYSATSMAASELVSQRFGEDAGKTTGEILEATGSFSQTAWNIAKAFESSTSMASEIIKNAPRENKGCLFLLGGMDGEKLAGRTTLSSFLVDELMVRIDGRWIEIRHTSYGESCDKSGVHSAL